MKVKIVAAGSGQPQTKLAEAELHFEPTDGPLSGLKLIGFGVWKRTGHTGEYNVTFPARTTIVRGDRRTFALLRPIEEGSYGVQHAIRDAIVEAYKQAPIETFTS